MENHHFAIARLGFINQQTSNHWPHHIHHQSSLVSSKLQGTEYQALEEPQATSDEMSGTKMGLGGLLQELVEPCAKHKQEFV